VFHFHHLTKFHMSDRFIQVRSAKFAKRPNEDDELVNEGMYGQALAEYLQAALRQYGYVVPFFCCEDWGWWVEIQGFPCTFGVCIYGRDLGDGQLHLAVTDGTTSRKIWSWRRFRSIDLGPIIDRLHEDLLAIFDADADVQILARQADSVG
jgi:hypothetical protein